MWVSTRILGATTARALEERGRSHVLVIGSDKFTRANLAGVGCFNYLAAATLGRVIKRDAPGIKNVRDVFESLGVDDLVLPSIGPIALAVLGAAFELVGVGGERPLEKWVESHRGKDEPDDLFTFMTLKSKERKRLEREAPRKSRRLRRGTR